MITTCLPLALPPHSADSSTYLTGILHIAPIYLQFESSWDVLLQELQPSDNVAGSTPSETTFEEYLRTHQRQITQSVLLPLRVPGLQRSERLCADIQSLTGYTDKLVSAALASSGRLPSLKAFTDHIQASTVRNPHVLLAYAWVMYMAIFSGGRYLRASLQDAGEGFWTGETANLSTEGSGPADQAAHEDTPKKYGRRGDPNNVMPGLSFFHFPGEEDGEDIKLEFKRRYAELEVLLSDAERDDVVREAHIIFESMGAIVKELDFLCRGTNYLEQIATHGAMPSSGGVKQAVRRLMRSLGRQFSIVGPKFGTLASMKSASGSSKSGVAWSLSVLCSVVAVGSVALLWRSVRENIPVLGFAALDTQQ